MRHQDGTHPSDPAAVQALSDEDRRFLEQAMQEYSQVCPADKRLSTTLHASSSLTLSKQLCRWLLCHQPWPMGRCRCRFGSVLYDIRMTTVHPMRRVHRCRFCSASAP